MPACQPEGGYVEKAVTSKIKDEQPAQTQGGRRVRRRSEAIGEQRK